MSQTPKQKGKYDKCHKKGKNRGHSDSQAGTISASKKVMWAPHNERNVLMSVDWKG